MVSISWLRLSTAPSIFKCGKKKDSGEFRYDKSDRSHVNLDGYLGEINREGRVLVEDEGSFLIQPVELQGLPFPEAERDNNVRNYTYKCVDYIRQRFSISFITHGLL